MIDGQPCHLRREMSLSRFLQCSSAQAEPDYDALLHSGHRSRFPRVSSTNDRAVSLCATAFPPHSLFTQPASRNAACRAIARTRSPLDFQRKSCKNHPGQRGDTVNQIRFINPQALTKPPGYTHVVEATVPGRLVYIAGQLGLDRDGKLSSDFRLQAVQTFENLKAALAAVGAQFQHLVKLNNYLLDTK